MFNRFERLCRLYGTSGRESAIRDYILTEVSGYADCVVDKNGNLLCHKKGAKPARKKIMVDAHIDEVGLIVTHITSEGFIKFSCVGGIMPAVISGKRVVFEGGTLGVVCSKPTHLCSAEEKKKYLSVDNMYIDIGAADSAEAESVVSLGDTAVFEENFLANGRSVFSKAIDDRVGVAVLIELLRQPSEYDFYASFTVQEEVGCRGAKTAAYALKPDGAIVLEATTAADLEGVEEDKRVCALSGGTTVSFMDRSTLYDKGLFDAAMSCRGKTQVKAAVAGGNNSGAIHLSRSGVPTIALSVPCRYIHSPNSVADLSDIENTLGVAGELLSKMASGEVL